MTAVENIDKAALAELEIVIRRIRSQPDMAKAATHDADLATAERYRRQADATSDRVLRQGYTEMANEIESRTKKGNQK